MATHLWWVSAPSIFVAMELRMYRAEPSLVMNAERSGPKLPLCPSCAQNMRLIRRTQRFGSLPDVCTFECRGCGVSHFEECAPASWQVTASVN
jgi:hypothetical protein